MKKINARLVMMQCVLLIIVVGGSNLLYSFLGPTFYRNHRIKLLTEAFETLRDIDLGDIGTDMGTFLEYESLNFNFIIVDRKMQSVYMTRTDVPESIYKNIQIRKADFSTTPMIIHRRNSSSESIRLLGLIKQGKQRYYVCIKDKTRLVQESFELTVIIFDIMFFIAMVFGSIIIYFMSGSLLKPIKELEQVTKKIARRDFSQKAKEKGKFKELNSLAININSMAEQIQEYIQSIEMNKERLVQQNLQQEHMAKARKDFVSNVSHELKTPLAVISSQVEMLEYLKAKEERDYYYTSIQEEIAKMSEMVGNLLDITAMEHTMGKVMKKEISFNEIVSYILLKYNALFQRKNIQIETALEENCMICGDREYLEQAVNNYIMNAFQHTENGNKIKISLEQDSADIKFRVYNQGKTIAEKDKEKIWKSFYVTEQEREKEEENGLGHTGLGLYIVKSVIEMHEGKYGVQNKEDGVEFWFSLPKMVK